MHMYIGEDNAVRGQSLQRVCVSRGRAGWDDVSTCIIINKAAVIPSSDMSNTVLLAIKCLSPLNVAAAHFHATFSSTVPLTPQVAVGELTRSNLNANVSVWCAQFL